MFEGEAKGFLNVRGVAADIRVSVADVLGVELPVRPCTFVRVGRVAVYWLGPDEWLAMVPNDAQAPLAARLRDALAVSSSVVDVSGAYAVFNLGADAEAVLKEASPCDFHPHVFPPGRCVQTVFAKAHALIAANADETFDVIVRTSYADYVRRWIGVSRHQQSPSS